MEFKVNKRYLIIRSPKYAIREVIEATCIEISPKREYVKFKFENSLYGIWAGINDYEIIEELNKEAECQCNHCS